MVCNILDKEYTIGLYSNVGTILLNTTVHSLYNKLFGTVTSVVQEGSPYQADSTISS
jgi:hypothetical protein